MKLDYYFPLAETLSRLLFPHAEVVIHDLKSGKIKALFNNFSKRKVGDPSLIEKTDDFSKSFPIYTKINWDGRKLRSMTAPLKDGEGVVIGLLCINLDISKFEEVQNFLAGWLETKAAPKVFFEDDWKEKVNGYVAHYLKEKKMVLKALSKEEKRELVLSLQKEGAFEAKNSASYIADILDLSRATLYNYLKERSVR